MPEWGLNEGRNETKVLCFFPIRNCSKRDFIAVPATINICVHKTAACPTRHFFLWVCLHYRRGGPLKLNGYMKLLTSGILKWEISSKRLFKQSCLKRNWHTSVYHRPCIMFFSQHFSFPCQYHSTNVPYSIIHLPPTLYNVFLPALQFPLSVSFHQCSILIHSSTTNAV